MDPLVLELKKIYARLRKIELRIAADESLCRLVKECQTRIEQQLACPRPVAY